MNTFLAMLLDTWRQAKQQIVLPLLMVVVGLFCLGWVMLCQVAPMADGTYVLTRVGVVEPEWGLDAFWDSGCEWMLVRDKRFVETRAAQAEAERAAVEAERARVSLAIARQQRASDDVDARLLAELEAAQGRFEEKRDALDELKNQVDSDIRRQVEQYAPGLGPVEKGVQVWLSIGLFLLTVLAMLGFIAAGSAFYPAMLGSGAVDVLLAKPIRRYELFFAKYLSGVTLMSALMVAAVAILFVGMGFRTGVWHLRLFAAVPILVFIVSLILAVVLAVGVMSRSTPLAIVVGFVYYIIVELIIFFIQQIPTAAWPPAATLGEVMRWTFPGFVRLKLAASAAVWNLPIVDWQPLMVGTVWLVVLLGAAYFWFERSDF